MSQIIRDREIVEDDFGTDEQPIVPLAEYAAAPDALLARYPKLGVRVPSDKLPADIPQLERLALIAIEFPRFTDGRGYSVARMLRDRHGFRGELRAVGWVLRDNLLYMQRCGFNAFELKAGKPLDHVLDAFAELPERRPIYRR